MFDYSTAYHKIIDRTAAPCKNIFLLFQIIDFPIGFPLAQDRTPTPIVQQNYRKTQY